MIQNVNDYLKHEKMAYTIEEAASLVSLSRAQLYRLIDRGELETIKIGKSRRVTSKQLDSFLQAREKQQNVMPYPLLSIAPVEHARIRKRAKQR